MVGVIRITALRDFKQMPREGLCLPNQ